MARLAYRYELPWGVAVGSSVRFESEIGVVRRVQVGRTAEYAGESVAFEYGLDRLSVEASDGRFLFRLLRRSEGEAGFPAALRGFLSFGKHLR